MQLPSLRLAYIVLAACPLILPAQAQLYDKIIQTQYGPVKGFQWFNSSFANATILEERWNTNFSNVAAWLGVPFAADTSGQNRWKVAQPRDPWNDTLIADQFGAPCPSSYVDNWSEDCLSVNIWSGANSTDAKLPVLVWNQGGGQTTDESIYYGGPMAMKGVVVVTWNRRDGIFGFLGHPELAAENEHNSTGNYGTLDHVTVLHWVQKNIAKFGGDPDHVTIAGQSFGSAQVYHAVNSDLFKGLFVGAIAQSGFRYPYDTLLAGLATSYTTREVSYSWGYNATATYNVSSVAELRNVSAEDLLGISEVRDYNNIWWVTALSAQYPVAFKPMLDGYVLPEKYIETLLNGPPNDVPVITGNNKDESGAATSTNLTVAEYTADCKLKYANLSTEYFKLYPANNDTQADQSWNAAARDTSLVSSWAFANEWVKSASSPIWTYYWDHAPPGQTQGAFHQSEIYYILNSVQTSTDYPFDWYDLWLGDVMSAYWANFIKTGNPNNGGSYKWDNLTQWDANDGSSETVFHVGQGFGNVTLTEKPAQVDLIMEYFSQQTPY